MEWGKFLVLGVLGKKSLFWGSNLTPCFGGKVVSNLLAYVPKYHGSGPPGGKSQNILHGVERVNLKIII